VDNAAVCFGVDILEFAALLVEAVGCSITLFHCGLHVLDGLNKL
jgi:hypothetical protein